MSDQLFRLDDIAALPTKQRRDVAGPLSTGEYLYVALAADDAEMLKRADYTIPQALARIGDEWIVELIRRWQYR